MVMSARSTTKEMVRGELRWSSKGEVNSSLSFAVVGSRRGCTLTCVYWSYLRQT